MHQFAVFTGNSRYDVVVDRSTMRPLMLKQQWGTDTGLPQDEWFLLSSATRITTGERLVVRFADRNVGDLTTSPVRDCLATIGDDLPEGLH